MKILSFSTNFVYIQPIFDTNQINSPDLNRRDDFDGFRRRFRWISLTILDRISWLKDDSNPISNDFKLKVDYIALA